MAKDLITCKTVGAWPTTGRACQHHVKANNSCKLPEGETCSSQQVAYSGDEIESREFVEVPQEVKEKHQRLSQVQTPYELLEADQISNVVREALSLIDTIRQADDAYLDSPEQLERDALKLTSLHATITTLATQMDREAANASLQAKSMAAEKAKLIKSNEASGLRIKVTDKTTDRLVDADSSIKEIRQIQLDHEARAKTLHYMARAVIEHVNMIKRRVDGLREETKRAAW